MGGDGEWLPGNLVFSMVMSKQKKRLIARIYKWLADHEVNLLKGKGNIKRTTFLMENQAKSL